MATFMDHSTEYRKRRYLVAKSVKARINGRPQFVDLNHCLESGDVVEVIPDDRFLAEKQEPKKKRIRV